MGFLSKLAILADYGSEKINTDFEIPFLAGYSKDGRTIYIDKRLPKWFRLKDGRTINIYKYLAWHERFEKLLEDGFVNVSERQWKDFQDWLSHKKKKPDVSKHLEGYRYDYAHEMATDKEREMVEADGIDWDEYQNYMLKMVQKLKKFSGRQPDDLDLKPEKDSHDYYRYHKVKTLQGKEKEKE